jgi:hypothetical protein
MSSNKKHIIDYRVPFADISNSNSRNGKLKYQYVFHNICYMIENWH